MKKKAIDWLTFNFPEMQPKKDLDKKVPITKDTLTAWRAELPMLNLMRLTTEIRQYLRLINRTDLSDDNRFKLLETIRPTVMYMTEMVHNKFTRENALTKQSKTQRKLMTSVVNETTLGYLRLLVNAEKSGWLGANNKEKALLTERVLFHICDYLRISYLHVVVESAGIWQQLNTVFGYALSAKVADVKVKDLLANTSGKITVSLAYKRAVLLVLTESHRLDGDQVQQVFLALGELAPLLSIKSPENTGASFKFVVDLNSNHPPMRKENFQADSAHQQLDLTSIHSKLSAWLHNKEFVSAGENKHLSESLLKYIVSKLSIHSQRKEVRVTRQNTYKKAVIGLSNIIAAMKPEGIKAAVAPVAMQDKLSITIAGNLRANEVMPVERVVLDEIVSQKDPEQEAPIKAVLLQDKADYHRQLTDKSQTFKLLEESENGAKISRQGTGHEPLELGGFLVIEGETPQNWILAQVKWYRLPNTTELLLGIRLLSMEFEWCRLSPVDIAGNNTHETIRYTDFKGNIRLLLPTSLYKVQSPLTLTRHDAVATSQTIMLEKPHHATKGYAQFSYT